MNSFSFSSLFIPAAALDFRVTVIVAVLAAVQLN